LVVAGIYFYRKLIEAPSTSTALGSAKPKPAQPENVVAAAGQIVGVGPLASTGRFIVGFGFTFLVLSLLEGASPKLSGNLALLIALGAVLGNGLKVIGDLQGQLSEKQQALSKLGALTEPNTPTVQMVNWEGSPGVGMPVGPRSASSPPSTKLHYNTRSV
jgi:hypothetical protein